MLGFSHKKNADKAPHRGAGALIAPSFILAAANVAAVESTGNTLIDTARYGASAALLGVLGVFSFVKFGRNFEATMPLPQKVEAAKAPKRPHRGRGAGPLFVTSSILAAANGAAIETFSNAGDVRDAGTAILLGGMALTSLVSRLRQPAYEFAKVGAPVAEFPSIEDERMAKRRSPVIVRGAAEFSKSELLKQVAERIAQAEAASLQAAFNGISHPVS